MFLVSATSWFLIAVLTNLIGNVVPVLFQFERYFIACALFGLGLGFLKCKRPIADQTESAVQSHTSMIESGWAIWLAVLTAVLFLVSCIDYPGGLQNAIALALLDESHDIFDFGLLKHSLVTDVFTVLLCPVLLFCTVQIFTSTGKYVGQLEEGIQARFNLIALAVGAAVGWLAYAALTYLQIPPYLSLALCCFGFLTTSQKRKLCSTLCLFAVVSCFYTSTAPLVAEKHDDLVDPKPNNSFFASSFFADGSRVDTRRLAHDIHPLGRAVFVDRLLYCFLPGYYYDPQDAQYLQKHLGLPDFAVDFRQLPYMAMPPMKGKTALILGPGIGSDGQIALEQRFSHIVYVEPNKWLNKLSEREPKATYVWTEAEKVVEENPRQYLRHTMDKYDLILFTAGAAVNRPDPLVALNHNDFLFTAEGLADAYNHLEPNGQLVIASQAANEIVRLRLAASILPSSNKIDASLTTPFANYLIVSKSNDSFAPANTLIESLRKKLGGKIVNHEQWLTEGAKGMAPYTDDRPFMMGQAPMMPLSDTFFMEATMLMQLLALRVQIPDTMLQNITRQRCRIFLMGSIYMILFCKACMIVSFQLGLTPPVILGSIVYGWLVLALALLPSYKGKGLPPGITWIGFLIALSIDFAFNYNVVNFATTMVLPWLAPLFVAAGVPGQFSQNDHGPADSGLFVIGLSLGLLFAISALFNGIASLDLLAAFLAGLCGLLTWLPWKHQRAIIDPA